MPQKRQFDDFITITDLWHLYLGNIQWFVWSLLICMIIATYYLVSTPNMYTREAAILVKQENQGKNTNRKSASDEFNDLGIIQQNTNVNNVRRHLVSLNVIIDVVKRLNLAEGANVVQVAEGIKKRLKVTIDDDKSTVISLKYVDSSPTLAEDILNTIVLVYNEQWVSDKNEITINTSNFINDRLSLIEKDLSNVDDSISTYKTRNQITDLGTVSDHYLQQLSQSDAEIMRLNNQKAMMQYIHGILINESNKYQLLPSNSGVNNQAIEAQITQYNNQLLQLNNHLAYTSNQNPLIINKEKVLSHLRTNIIHNIDNLIQTLDIQLSTLQGHSGDASSKITSNPEQAKFLASIERQQKVKESLYLYLLQKLEENEINMTYTSYNTQIIDIPHGSDEPTSPNKRNILFASFILGLLIPAAILFVRRNLDNTVRNKSDLERKTSIPLIGEIPVYRDNEKKNIFLSFWKQDNTIRRVVVKPDSTDLVNEAFRIIRSNIEFMTSESLNEGNVYVITSSHPNSGKTFVAMNLAASLAIKEKRVLFIDGDLRHASASTYWSNPPIGLSNYLGGKEKNISNLLKKSSVYPTLDIIPVGTIPPNPTELLSNNRLHELLEELRSHYDYIFIDSPPVENLADANIIEKYADRTLFIIRAGMFERKRIIDLEEEYQTGKHQHTSLILNYIQMDGRYGYKYKYKYGYKHNYHSK